MSHHSVAETKNRLSELIDRALKGEYVVITRHGTPVAELRPVRRSPARITQAGIDWLVARKMPRKRGPDAGSLVSSMRDEEDR